MLHGHVWCLLPQLCGVIHLYLPQPLPSGCPLPLPSPGIGPPATTTELSDGNKCYKCIPWRLQVRCQAKLSDVHISGCVAGEPALTSMACPKACTCFLTSFRVCSWPSTSCSSYTTTTSHLSGCRKKTLNYHCDAHWWGNSALCMTCLLFMYWLWCFAVFKSLEQSILSLQTTFACNSLCMLLQGKYVHICCTVAYWRKPDNARTYVP